MAKVKNRRLASIVFADIAGYTTLMQKDETAAADMLRSFQKIVQETVNTYHGEIPNFYGDGALCVFENTLEAVQCAIAMQKSFAAQQNLPVRIGIHNGTVVFENAKVFGDSVNLASRVESMGVAGAVLISKKVRDDLKNRPEFRTKSLGKFEFKNVDNPMEVYALSNQGLVVPDREEMEGKLKEKRSVKSLGYIALISVLIFLFGMFILKYSDLWFTPNKSARVMNNSLAVLPFSNISAEIENQYFADGMHDDLLTHLSGIGDMKVISRTSVLRFRDTDQAIPEIAKMLDVSHILEGTVRRSGNQVRINVQLINAELDDHIWAEIYDRELSTDNIFAIQTEIAENIARELEASMKPKTRDKVDGPPTDNLQAYEEYLRAKQLLEVRNASSLFEAQKLLENAISLDPDFALAYIYLGEVYMLMETFTNQNRETCRLKAKENMEKGMSIDNELAEAHALKGHLLGKYDMDLELASISFERSLSINPNYARAYHWYALTIRRLSSNYERAIDVLTMGRQVDPLSSSIIVVLAESYFSKKDYSKALKILGKGISLGPDYPSVYMILGRTYNYVGQLDSAAIYAHKAVDKNSDLGIFKHTYSKSLLQLGMFSEVLNQVNLNQSETKQDSLLLFELKLEINKYNGNYKEALQLINETSLISDDRKKYHSRKIHYLNRDFEKVLLAGDKLSWKNLGVSNYNELKDFQEYLYSLNKLDHKEKYKLLWKEYGHLVVDKPLNIADNPSQTRSREFIEIRHSLLNGDKEKGLDQIRQFFENNVILDWMQFKSDPVIDEIRNDPEYMKIMEGVQNTLTIQRASFQKYLSMNN